MGRSTTFESFPGYTKLQVEAFVKMKLKMDIEWAKKALLKIYDNQTQEEREKGMSIDENEIGFNRLHGPILTAIAKKLKRRQPLIPGEIEKIHFIMPKYAAQAIKFCKRDLMEKHLARYYGRDLEKKLF